MFFGMTWPGNRGPCSACPPNAAYLADRAACECDVYHYGPACGLCRPEWDAATCDGSACAAGYLDGVPAAFQLTDGFPLAFNCSVCDHTAGYCRSTWVGPNGALCAPCTFCHPTGGLAEQTGTVNATCVCAARFRGASCEQCMPRFANPAAGCTECAPGYVSSDPSASPPTCDMCDTDGGFCHGATAKPHVANNEFLNTTLLLAQVETVTSQQPAYDGTSATVDIFRLLPDPYMLQCAPCADCDPFYGSVENATCICRELAVADWPGRDYGSLGSNFSSAFGPSCSMQAEAIQANLCFPAAARVRTASGDVVRLDELSTGTLVLAQNPRTGELGYTPVLTWWHHQSGQLRPRHPSDAIMGAVVADASAPPTFEATRYTRLTTASGAVLTLSARHLVPASAQGCSGASYASHAALTPAADVAPGAGLWVLASPSGVACSVVLSADAVLARGAYAPVTAWGTLVVDGVAASSLVAYGPWPLPALVAHHAAVAAAHRWLGAAGRALVEVLHAPFYVAAGVPQPTAAAVKRALAAPPPGCVDVGVPITARASQ